jgi:hypothetical protein
MNKSPFESKNEIFTNNDLISKNNILEINDKSGISFNKTSDKDYSPYSSLIR